MEDIESDARWQQLVAIRDELDGEQVAVPALLSRVDGRPRKPSPEAIRLARALAVTPSWSRMPDTRGWRMAA